MIKKFAFIAALAIALLAGCTGNVKHDAPPPQQLPKIHVDPSMLKPCSALPIFDTTAAMSMGDLYKAYGQLQGQYTECAIRLLCLIEVEQGSPKSCPAIKPTTTPGATPDANAGPEPRDSRSDR